MRKYYKKAVCVTGYIIGILCLLLTLPLKLLLFLLYEVILITEGKLYAFAFPKYNFYKRLYK